MPWAWMRGGGGEIEGGVWRRRDGGDMEYGGWGVGDGGGRGDEGGGWSRIEDEIESMECVEQNNTIGNNVMNDDVI